MQNGVFGRFLDKNFPGWENVRAPGSLPTAVYAANPGNTG